MPELLAYTKEDVLIHARSISAKYSAHRSLTERWWVVMTVTSPTSSENRINFSAYGPTLEFCYERLSEQMTRTLLRKAPETERK